MIKLPAPIFIVIFIIVFLFGMTFSTFIHALSDEGGGVQLEQRKQISKLQYQVDMLLDMCSK